jgi:hypothetical protein
MKLLRSETFKTGVQYLVYGLDDSPPEGTYEDAVKALNEAEQ